MAGLLTVDEVKARVKNHDVIGWALFFEWETEQEQAAYEKAKAEAKARR
jgi:hypothetical protein